MLSHKRYIWIVIPYNTPRFEFSKIFTFNKPIPGLRLERRKREPKSLVIPFHHPGEPTEGIEPPTGCLQNNYSTTELRRHLHIILFSPLPVNIIPCTFTFWATIERSIGSILPMPRRQFPRLLGFDFDYVAAWPHIVVEVVHIHTIYRLRVDTIPCRY